MIDLHGGTITVRSEGLHQGSEFGVRLPIVQRSFEETTTDRISKAPMGMRRILVVDDLRDSADSLATLLMTWGHEVRAVYDGTTALTAAREFLPQIIILDVGMPGLTGLEVCRRIRSNGWGKSMAIVALTGWGQPEDRRRTREAGFDHHLIKPADAAAIEELIGSLSTGAAPALAASRT